MKFKRLLSAIVALAMVLTTLASLGTVAFAADAEAAPAAESVTYKEDFENFTLSLNLSGDPTGATVDFDESMITTSGGLDVSFYNLSYNPSDPNADSYTGMLKDQYKINDQTKVDTDENGNKYLHVYDTTESGDLRFIFPAVTSGVVKASFKAAIISGWGNSATDDVWAIKDESFGSLGEGTYGQLAVKMLAGYGTAGYQFWNGTNPTYQSVAVADSTWHEFTYYADIEAKKYVVEVDGTSYGPYDFHQGTSIIDELLFKNYWISGEVREYKLDDIEITPVTTYYTVNLHGYDGADEGTADARPYTDTDAGWPVPSYIPDGLAFEGWYKDEALTLPVESFFALEKEGVTDVYAKFVDAVPVPDVYSEDFSSAGVDIENYTITDSDFTVALGKPSSRTSSTWDNNNFQIKTDGNSMVDGDPYLWVYNRSNDSGNVYFQLQKAVTGGKVKVSYDMKVIKWTEYATKTYSDQYWKGALDGRCMIFSGDNLDSVTSAVTIYTGNNDHKGLRVNQGFNITQGAAINLDDTGIKDSELVGDEWFHIDQYIDMDSKKHAVQINGMIYGPFDLYVDSINGLYFTGYLNDGWGGPDNEIGLDNIVVDTKYTGDIPDSNIDETIYGEFDGGGKAIKPMYQWQMGKNITIEQGGSIKNVIIDTGSGSITDKNDNSKVYTGRIKFDANGNVDVEEGKTVKYVEGTTQGFMQKATAPNSYIMKLTANGGDYTNVEYEVNYASEYEKVSDIIDGPIRFEAIVTGVPEGVTITAEYGAAN